MAGAVTAGRFRIARVGSTVSGYLGNTLIYARTSTTALAATFDNFHFTAACR
jgi:hypothetical protein